MASSADNNEQNAAQTLQVCLVLDEAYLGRNNISDRELRFARGPRSSFSSHSGLDIQHFEYFVINDVAHFFPPCFFEFI